MGLITLYIQDVDLPKGLTTIHLLSVLFRVSLLYCYLFCLVFHYSTTILFCLGFHYSLLSVLFRVYYSLSFRQSFTTLLLSVFTTLYYYLPTVCFVWGFTTLYYH